MSDTKTSGKNNMPYLPPEIIHNIISNVDDIDIRRYFGIYRRIPHDDWRFKVLLKMPMIRQIHGKFHPTNGANGRSYGEVIIPQKPADLHITVLPIKDYVCWENFTNHMYNGITLIHRTFL